MIALPLSLTTTVFTIPPVQAYVLIGKYDGHVCTQLFNVIKRCVKNINFMLERK